MKFSLAFGLVLISMVPAEAQTALCKTVLECAQSAAKSSYEAKLVLEVMLPKGAVVPFNLASCPANWSPLPAVSGRVIVGAGQGDGLTNRAVGERGGEEQHTLSIAEMPSHNHANGTYNQLMTMDGDWTITEGDGNGPTEPNLVTAAPIASSGGDQPHNNMQPYVSMIYCTRN